MFENTTVEEKTIFLLKFTKELISNSKEAEIYRLEERIRRRVGLPSLFREIKIISKEEIQEKIKENFSKKESRNLEINKEIKKIKVPFSDNERKIISLTVPRPKFQENLQILKVPLAPDFVNFGKLEDLAKDPNVKVIEFQGENQKIVVEGNMGRKFTGIIINQGDARELLEEFSNKTKIPITNGINKINAGNFSVTAIVSSDKINNFLIKKTNNLHISLGIPKPNR